MEQLNILLVDDDEDDFFLTQELLQEVKPKYSLEWAKNYDMALDIINEKIHDVYLVDYRLGHRSGLELLDYLKQKNGNSPVIILTGQSSEEIDMEAMKKGAADYLVKGTFDADMLERSIRYARDQSRLVSMLRENEKKYRNIFEGSRDIIFLIDKEGKVLNINPAGQKMLGYSNDDISGINKDSLFSIVRDKMSTFTDIIDTEISFQTKEGKKRYCIFNTALIDPVNNIYMGICHDISERKKIEETQRSADKFIASGKIARMIAHEVRNPLTNIQLAIEQLRHISQNITDSKLYLDLIKRNGERINNLITQLLQSTKFEELGLKKCSINEIIDETIELARDRINLKKITVIKYYSKNKCNSLIDREKIKIAFLNIILNAVEAMEEQTGKLEITTEKRDDKCLIAFTDNGKGIKKEDLDQLFVPFFTNKPNGTGLGLTTTQNIILNHKGNIQVISEQGKGTTFQVTLNTL